ncbi:MAG: hypothetical protein BGO29_04605 [Bacteroidales bacterium 36-12]|nr:MAG: hypothetical protein BGO29_04605 [Bacteroidales bacterium 36-12]
MYKTTFRTSVKTENSLIEVDGYSTIKVTNTGDDVIIINDNIQIAANLMWHWKNDPDVVIDVPVYIRFAGTGVSPKALIEQYYFQKI